MQRCLKLRFSILSDAQSYHWTHPSQSPTPLLFTLSRRTTKMTIYTLSIGLTLRREQQLLEFRRMLSDDEIQFEDPLTGRIYNWSLAKLYREINENRLQVVTGKK